jgi:hypothetical protein
MTMGHGRGHELKGGKIVEDGMGTKGLGKIMGMGNGKG